MTNWTIRPLQFAGFPAFEKSNFTYGKNQGVAISAPCLGFLLQSTDQAILVDCGPSAPEVAARYHPMITTRTPEQAPDAALRDVGVAPGQIRTVVVSHLHWDHCYNMELFPEARFVVQAEEIRHAVDPIPTQRVPYEVGIPGLTPPWLPFFNRLRVVRGDVEIAPGVQVVLLPGHTPGLQGVLVHTAAGRHLIASDAVPLYENLGREGGEPIPPGIHVDVAACFQSFEKMRRVADVVLPSHDVQVLEHTIYPA